MQNLRKFILAAIAVGIFLFGFFMMRYLRSLKEAPPQRPASETARYVKATPITFSSIPTTIESSGRVLSEQTVAAIAEASGKILKGDVPLKQGQSFNKGQALYRIDDRETRYSLSAQKSQFLKALTTSLPDIKIDYPDQYSAIKDFQENIHVEKSLPELPAIDNQALLTFLASREILNSFYSIKSTEERLKKHVYYAPFNGTFQEVLLETGSVASMGVKIATIIQSKGFEIEVPISEGELKWISKGQEVSIEASEESLVGKVKRISDYLDPQTQSVNIYVAVDAADNQLYNGMYVNVSIAGPTIDKGMVIPRKAIFNENQVFLVKNGKLAVKNVELKKVNTESAVINGLPEGDTIVVESVVNGLEDMRVKTVTK